MKVDPVVNNADELFMANITQINKIKYLEAQKSKRQSYIKDLQESLALNKQSISLLATEKKIEEVLNLNSENQLLHKKLKQYYEDYMNVNALLLIQQQLRIQEKKFYNERLLDFQTNMIELRKYLQDKQQSFASVVNRLKKYQQLSEVTLETKLHKFTNELGEEYISEHIRKITQERDKYKTAWEKYQISVEDFSFLKACLENKQSYQSMLQSYVKLKEKQKQNGIKQDKGISFYQKTKNTTNASNTFNNKSQIQPSQSALIKNPNRQLIKLLKKQKLNNQILQQALNQAIEKNEQLIIQNNILVNANSEMQITIQKLQSKGYLLEQELTKYDKSLAWTQQWKTERNNNRQNRINQFKYKGEQDEICLMAMQQDMQKLSSFIMTCVPKGNLIKSSSNPNFARPIEETVQQGEGEVLQIQEI